MYNCRKALFIQVVSVIPRLNLTLKYSENKMQFFADSCANLVVTLVQVQSREYVVVVVIVVIDGNLIDFIFIESHDLTL